MLGKTTATTVSVLFAALFCSPEQGLGCKPGEKEGPRKVGEAGKRGRQRERGMNIYGASAVH